MIPARVGTSQKCTCNERFASCNPNQRLLEGGSKDVAEKVAEPRIPCGVGGGVRSRPAGSGRARSAERTASQSRGAGGIRQIQGREGRRQRRLHPGARESAFRALWRGDRHRARRYLHSRRRRLCIHYSIGVEAVHRGPGDAATGQCQRGCRQDRRRTHRAAVQLHPGHAASEAGIGEPVGQFRSHRLGQSGQSQERRGALRLDQGLLRAAGRRASSL